MQHRVSRGSPRMDGNTKDGRHPRLECPVLFLASCLPFSSNLFYSSSTFKTLLQGNLFLFPEQFEVILGLGLPIFRSKKIFCKPVNDIRNMFSLRKRRVVSEKNAFTGEWRKKSEKTRTKFPWFYPTQNLHAFQVIPA